MKRFFMSVEEAVQLVLQASVLSTGRDIFMLEMGKPVPIIELAHRMIKLSGARVEADIPIKVVGMRPGEKLEEDLREPDEEVMETEHLCISRLLPVSAQSEWFDSCLQQLAEATDRCDSASVRRLLFAIAGTADDGNGVGLLEADDGAPSHLNSHQRHRTADFSPEPAST
jgi:FlaA1/EpsC-like NDP-sugar epimerase